jgi:glycosyltransferase involved in cell wall biosynthesis
MKISVLTVSYNSSATISHTIESFLVQDHKDKEMIVIDGASQDGTVDIVRSFANDQITLISEVDDGMYDGLNKGLERFTGDAVGVLNSDDAYHDSTALSRIADELGKAEIVHGHLDFVEDHASKRIVRRWRAAAKPASGFRTGWMPAHPTFYVRRAVAERVGSFDLSLKTASDYDWMLRAVELNDHSISRINHVLIDMQRGGKSTVSLGAHVIHNLEALRARRRWLKSGLIDYALIAKPARKIGQFVGRGNRTEA